MRLGWFVFLVTCLSGSVDLSLAVSTKPLAPRTLRVTLLRCSSANDLACYCDFVLLSNRSVPQRLHFVRHNDRCECLIIKKNTIEIPIST